MAAGNPTIWNFRIVHFPADNLIFMDAYTSGMNYSAIPAPKLKWEYMCDHECVEDCHFPFYHDDEEDDPDEFVEYACVYVYVVCVCVYVSFSLFSRCSIS
jgi:hypothetical protein